VYVLQPRSYRSLFGERMRSHGMYTLVRNLGVRKCLQAEATPLVVSLAIAEAFFHFHSFTLECIAFLATWYVASSLARAVMELKQRFASGR